MNTIIEAVHEDWSSLVNRIKNETPDLKDAVHSALGALIKQRKVYYTGNKGYFLVGPTENGSNGSVSSSGGTNGCTPMLFGTKFSHLRHSLRDRTSSSTPPMQEKLNGSGSASGGSLSSGIIFDSFFDSFWAFCRYIMYLSHKCS